MTRGILLFSVCVIATCSGLALSYVITGVQAVRSRHPDSS